MKNALKIVLGIALCAGLSSCEDDNQIDNQINDYPIPTTYTFANVDYSGQTTRLDMMEEMATYMKTGNNGAVLDATKLKAMYGHEADAVDFSTDALNTSGKNLKSKTFSAAGTVEKFEGFMDAIALASISTTAGSNGIAGVVYSADSAKQYLLNENGLEYTQIIEKGLMGACMMYQGTGVYLEDDKMDLDLNILLDLWHHWDEAFGYTGLTENYPTETEGLRFWGKYANDRNDLTGLADDLMTDLIKGRAALVNDDITTRDEMRTSIQENWEKVSAATAIHYINSGINNIGDNALRSHALSEAIAFVDGLRYTPNNFMTPTTVDAVLAKIGGSSDFEMMNLYNVTLADLQSAIDDLAAVYGFEAIKGQL